MILINVEVSTVGMSLVSGFGGLLSFYIPEYAAAGKGYAAISQLMTYPTLFMYVASCVFSISGFQALIRIGESAI